MSELENSPITPDSSDARETGAETAPPAADAAAASAEASAAELPPAAVDADATGEPAEAAAAVEPAAPTAAPRAKKAGARPKGEKGDRKPREKRHRPAGKSVDEFVQPTPEELALVPSEIVQTAIANQAYVEGKVIGWNQGGFHVVVDGITSFCPRSSMELGAPKEPAQYLDQSFLFRVLRVEEKGHRLVVSHAAVLRDERAHKTAETRAALTLGSTVTGKVISLTDFGAFVDLGGIEGLIHVSELKRTRVTHPNEVLKVGDEVTAKIIKLPKGGDRVSLSMKALEPDPWDGIAAQFANGSKFTGKVMRKSEFGWFVELAPGVEGLLHVSQLSRNPVEDPRAVVKEGEVHLLRIVSIDQKRQRIGLSLKAVTPTEQIEWMAQKELAEAMRREEEEAAATARAARQTEQPMAATAETEPESGAEMPEAAPVEAALAEEAPAMTPAAVAESPVDEEVEASVAEVAEAVAPAGEIEAAATEQAEAAEATVTEGVEEAETAVAEATDEAATTAVAAETAVTEQVEEAETAVTEEVEEAETAVTEAVEEAESAATEATDEAATATEEAGAAITEAAEEAETAVTEGVEEAESAPAEMGEENN